MATLPLRLGSAEADFVAPALADWTADLAVLLLLLPLLMLMLMQLLLMNLLQLVSAGV